MRNVRDPAWTTYSRSRARSRSAIRIEALALGDAGMPRLEFAEDERGDEGVQVVADRVVGGSQEGERESSPEPEPVETRGACFRGGKAAELVIRDAAGERFGGLPEQCG